MKPKVQIVACADNFHFIDPLIPALSAWFDIQKIELSLTRSDNGFIKELVLSDLIWFEWADGYSIDFLKYMVTFNCPPKIILRLHRYELFTPRTLKNLENISYKRINNLVFVSDVVQAIGIDKFPWMANSVVIPNLIDHTKFPLMTNKSQGFNILMLGRMSYVKNLPLALTMFYELLKTDNRYKLHVVGEISDPELVYYCANFLEKAKIEKHVIFHGRVPNDRLPELMKEMSFLLCASIFESQGIGVLEAMSCGLKPLIFNFPGADINFPKRWLWLDFSQLYEIIQSSFIPAEYNLFVYENFSIEKNIHRYRSLIEGVLNNDSFTQSEKD